MKAKRLQFPPTFELENGDRVVFEPAIAPPFTHKVLLMTQSKEGFEKVGQDWFAPDAGHKINVKTALYFWEKHLGKTVS